MLNIDRKADEILLVSIELKKSLKEIESRAAYDRIEYQMNESIKQDKDSGKMYSQVEFSTLTENAGFRGIITNIMTTNMYKHAETECTINKVLLTYTCDI